MNRKQFLLTKIKGEFAHLEEINKIGNYYLYIGIESEYCFITNQNMEFHLLGSIYDWEKPEYRNEQILEEISKGNKIQEILDKSNNYCGEYVFILKLSDEIFIFNDATSQKEVYYDDTFICFGTQPKLLEQSVELLEHEDNDAKKYYNSLIFKTNCLFVGNTTHKQNIFHLLPNHLLNITEKSVQRFFPTLTLDENTIKYTAKKCSIILKGYIKAISMRHKLKMAVTGGYDSRILFLSSLGVKCKYFVSRHSYMNNSHYDILIPKYLTNYYHKDFIVEDNEKIVKTIMNKAYINDIDFPRFLNVSNNDSHYCFINGNISEIARNYFGYHKNATAEDLCFLLTKSNLKFVIKQYQNWLKANSIFNKFGYNYLDMFYWEEKMGNWTAKAKTENYALNRDIASPFNSRSLLNLLLSTNRKYRDSHLNHLYNSIIAELSKRDSKIMKLRINPSKKDLIIRIMKHIKIYNLYRHLVVKTRRKINSN